MVVLRTRSGSIADKKTRYDTGALRAALGRIEDFHACMSADCSSGQIHEDADNNPISTCQACGLQHCVPCRVPWHRGLSCKKFRQKKEETEGEETRLRKKRKLDEEKASLDLLERATKLCPACNIKMEKIEDTRDIMTCKGMFPDFPNPEEDAQGEIADLGLP